MVQDFVPRTAPSVTIAVRDVTSTFVADEPTGTPDGSPGQSAGGSNGGGGNGASDGGGRENTAELQKRAGLGFAMALPIAAAVVVEM